MTKVLIVDDSNSIREFLKINLAGETDIEIVGLADNGQAAISQTEEHQPDLILMDINMPGMLDGIEATARIVQRFPDTKVLLLTSQDDQQQLDKALKAGSRGYILKNTSIKDIANIIRLAEKGFFQIGPIFDSWNGAFHNAVRMAEKNLEIGADWGHKNFSDSEPVISLPSNFSYALPADPTTEMNSTLSNLSSKLFQLQQTVNSQANTIANLNERYSQAERENNNQLYRGRSPGKLKPKGSAIYGSKAKPSRSQKQQHVLFISSFFLGVITVLILILLIVVVGSI